MRVLLVQSWEHGGPVTEEAAAILGCSVGAPMWRTQVKSVQLELSPDEVEIHDDDGIVTVKLLVKRPSEMATMFDPPIPGVTA